MVKAKVAYYSRTGHTRALSLEITRRLREAGLEVDEREAHPVKELGPLSAIHRVLTHSPEPVTDGPLELSDVQLLLIGSPVWGISPAPYIRSMLETTKDLKGLPVVLFATCSSKHEAAGEELRELVREMGGRPFAYEVWRINKDGPEGLQETATRVVEAAISLLPSGVLEGPDHEETENAST
jgi:flavodoxin